MTNANLVTQYRAAIQLLLASCDTCRAFELCFTSEGGAASLFQAGDFTGSNADLTPAAFVAFVNSRTAVETLLSANSNAHYTNLNKARP
jgi:hypothetical protein